MNEIVFTLFCGCGICLVLTVWVAVYVKNMLERSKDFMSFTYGLLKKVNANVDIEHEAWYDKGYEDAVRATFIQRNPVFANNSDNDATADDTGTVDPYKPEGTE